MQQAGDSSMLPLRIRVVLQWILLLASAGLLAAEARRTTPRGQSAGGDPAAGPEVISVWIGVIMGRWDEQATIKAVERFNRERDDIQIDLTLIPYTVYLAKLNLAISSGSPPDVVNNAYNVVGNLPKREQLIELIVPIPESMVSPAMRAAWGPSIMRAITAEGLITQFPSRTYLTGGVFVGNREHFELAGVDLRYYLEHGWDYETFKREMQKVQTAVRAKYGPEAYAFGLNLLNVPTLLYECLLPPIVGPEVVERQFLLYDEAAGRYRLDPAITPETLAIPLRFMQDLIHRDKLWGRKFLGLDFGQIVAELCERQELSATFTNTPGYSVSYQMLKQQEYDKGLRERPLRTTNVPVPTPHGEDYVFGVGADGWGVMKQIPFRGDAHTSAALEVARYLASPEVQAIYYVESKGMRLHLWPDAEAVEALTRDVPSVIDNDPWLTYIWELYEGWMKSARTYSNMGGDWPDLKTRRDLLRIISGSSGGSYLFAGEGRQILERVLFNELEPLEAARMLLAGAAELIDDYYRRHPEAINRGAAAPGLNTRTAATAAERSESAAQ